MINKKTLIPMFFVMISLFLIYGCTNEPSKRVCAAEAKLCPDGSYVGRTGTNCEFAPCPEGVLSKKVQTSNVSIEPEDQSKIGLSSYPDLPLDLAPSTPIAVGYLIEHRSALNEKAVTVNGIIVASWLDESKCPQNVGLLCPQPRIFLADTNNEDRNPHYDLDIKVGEEDIISELKKDYPIGKRITIKVLVYGDKTSVYAVKIG